MFIYGCHLTNSVYGMRPYNIAYTEETWQMNIYQQVFQSTPKGAELAAEYYHNGVDVLGLRYFTQNRPDIARRIAVLSVLSSIQSAAYYVNDAIRNMGIHAPYGSEEISQETIRCLHEAMCRCETAYDNLCEYLDVEITEELAAPCCNPDVANLLPVAF